MECSLGWNHTGDFKIKQACGASSIWNRKYDFRPKLHNTRFNYHNNIHFEITQMQDLVSSNILLMQYWAGLKLNSSIFWGEKIWVWKTKVATWYSLSFIFLQFVIKKEIVQNVLRFITQQAASDWIVFQILQLNHQNYV